LEQEMGERGGSVGRRAKAKVGAQLAEWMKSKKGKGIWTEGMEEMLEGREDNCHGGINIDVLDEWRIILANPEIDVKMASSRFIHFILFKFFNKNIILKVSIQSIHLFIPSNDGTFSVFGTIHLLHPISILFASINFLHGQPQMTSFLQ
jgi:hypothetical protein